MKEMVRYWYNEVNSLDLSHISNYTYQSTTEHFAILAWSRTDKIGETSPHLPSTLIYFVSKAVGGLSTLTSRPATPTCRWWSATTSWRTPWRRVSRYTRWDRPAPTVGPVMPVRQTPGSVYQPVSQRERSSIQLFIIKYYYSLHLYT